MWPIFRRIVAIPLVQPDKLGEFKKCLVPAGPKARIVAAYINDYAYRERTPVVDLGETMRTFMERVEIPVGGKNGKELQRELENFAAYRPEAAAAQ